MRIFISQTSFEFVVEPKLIALVIIAYLCTLMFAGLIALIAPELLEDRKNN
jgi:hypothetical protein